MLWAAPTSKAWVAGLYMGVRLVDYINIHKGCRWGWRGVTHIISIMFPFVRCIVATPGRVQLQSIERAFTNWITRSLYTGE